jgi:hypothetical protein
MTMSFDFKRLFRASVSGVCITLSLAWLFAPQIVNAQQGRVGGVDFLITPKKTFAFLPAIPLVVPGEIVLKAEWSEDQDLLWITSFPRPTGNNRLATTMAKGAGPAGTTLSVWKPGTLNVTRVLKSSERLDVWDVSQVFGTDWYLVKFSGENSGIVAVNVSTGVRKMVTGENEVELAKQTGKPPVMVQTGKDADDRSLKIFRFNVANGDWAEVPSFQPQGMVFAEHFTDEKTGNIVFCFESTDAGKKRFLVYDPARNAVVDEFTLEDLGRVMSYEHLKERPVWYVRSRTLSTGTTKAPYLSIQPMETATWRSEATAEMKIFGPTEGSASRDGRFLVMITNGTAAVREIIEVEAKDQEAIAKQEEAELSIRGKQLGIGMLLYSSDNDDIFSPSEDWQERIQPYIKNIEIVEGASFLLGYQNMLNIAEPEKTKMFRIDGAFGSVVVYADSSIAWFRKEKKPKE